MYEEKYNKAFTENLEIKEEQLAGLQYQGTEFCVLLLLQGGFVVGWAGLVWFQSRRR